MLKNCNNLCPLCGKQRIVVKTYKEKIGNSTVTYSETVCPDPECQKKMNRQNEKEEEKREMINKEQEKRDKEKRVRTAEKKNLKI